MSMSTATAVTMLDVRAGSGAITLPLTTQIPYRVITIKDAYGAAGLSSITINTQGTDVFENGTSSITLTNAYDTTTLYAGLPGYWYTVGGSRLQGASFNTLSTGVIVNPLRLGTISTQTSIQFPGLRSNYTGTAITEQTTGIGTQELLLYKASSISDQIRLQTTGNIVFEAGASARSFPSTTQLATPTLYIAGSTSNVGVGTATPAATLDVVGTGRFQTVSSLALNVSSINGAAPGGASFTGSTTTLSSAVINVSSLATNTVKTSSLTMYGTLNMTNNPLTNIYSALFAPSYSGINPNLSAGGSYTTYTSGSITYGVHIFTTVGTTTFVPVTSITGLQALIIAGGGSGGFNCAGGGGAGGLVYLTNQTLSSGSYNIVVGGGGVGNAVSGSNTTALGYTANGGGGGGTNNGGAGQSGGCGGGGSASSAIGGSATQTSIAASPYPGFAGGTAGSGYGGAGGGGMGSVGSNGSGNVGGNGGNGLAFSITGTLTTYCGGGGGGTAPTGAIPGIGGSGGGGAGGTMVAGTGTNGSNATNYGSGGGGGSGGASSGSGGSGYQGIVILAYQINQFGGLPYTVGTITGDANSNLSILPVNSLSIVGNTLVSGSLTASTVNTRFISASLIQTSTLSTFSMTATTASITNLSFVNSLTGPYISTQQLFFSSINGQTLGGILASTVRGLGTAGYISSVTIANLVSTANLATLVSTTYLATQLGSTVIGLGSAGYLSTIISSFFTVSTGILTASTITGNNASLNSLSTGFVTLSSVNFLDQATSAVGNVYQKNSLLYFNTLVFAGARTGPGQFLYPQ